MRSRLLSIASALALVLGGLVVALVPASPASADCSGHGTHPDYYEGGRIKYNNGVNIRSHPHVGCSAVGVGNYGDAVDVHCYTLTESPWIYIRNLDTGVSGWSRWDVLRYLGDSNDPPTYIASCGGVNPTAYVYAPNGPFVIPG